MNEARKYTLSPKLIWQLFLSFAQIGVVSIGGGYVMLPVMRQELSMRRKWIAEEEIMDFYAIGQSLPGLIAVNTAAVAGYRLGRLPGALAAILGVTLPSIIIITVIAAFFVSFQENIYVQKAFRGVRAAVLSLILFAVIKLGKRALTDWRRILIAVTAFALLAASLVSPPLVIAGGIIAGLLLNYRSVHVASGISEKQEDASGD